MTGERGIVPGITMRSSEPELSQLTASTPGLDGANVQLLSADTASSDCVICLNDAVSTSDDTDLTDSSRSVTREDFGTGNWMVYVGQSWKVFVTVTRVDRRVSCNPTNPHGQCRTVNVSKFLHRTLLFLSLLNMLLSAVMADLFIIYKMDACHHKRPTPLKVKVSSYIAQYPILSAFHFTSLADLFNQTPSQLLGEPSSHMLQLMREGCSYTYPPLSIARCSFIQLSELEQCRVKNLPKGLTPQHRIQTRILLVKSPKFFTPKNMHVT